MHYVTEFLSWLGETPLSVFMQESWWAFASIEATHVIAITLVVGTIMIVDLRLLGLASRNRAITEISSEVLPWTWRAFAVAVTAGTLMFVSNPVEYYGNNAFRIKVLLLFFAGLNMSYFQLITYRGVSKWNQDSRVPLPGKIAAVISLTCWIGIVFFGRRIGFTMYPS